MNGVAGIFGALGFLAYEISSYLSVGRRKGKLYGRLYGTHYYFGIVFCFAIVAAVIAMLFASPDLNAEVWPLKWSGLSVVEAARAFLVGLAAVHVYKIKERSTTAEGPVVRAESNTVELTPVGWREAVRWWRST